MPAALQQWGAKVPWEIDHKRGITPPMRQKLKVVSDAPGIQVAPKTRRDFFLLDSIALKEVQLRPKPPIEIARHAQMARRLIDAGEQVFPAMYAQTVLREPEPKEPVREPPQELLATLKQQVSAYVASKDMYNGNEEYGENASRINANNLGLIHIGAGGYFNSMVATPPSFKDLVVKIARKGDAFHKFARSVYDGILRGKHFPTFYDIVEEGEIAIYFMERLEPFDNAKILMALDVSEMHCKALGVIT